MVEEMLKVGDIVKVMVPDTFKWGGCCHKAQWGWGTVIADARDGGREGYLWDVMLADGQRTTIIQSRQPRAKFRFQMTCGYAKPWGLKINAVRLEDVSGLQTHCKHTLQYEGSDLTMSTCD